jgi:hypothetical protein
VKAYIDPVIVELGVSDQTADAITTRLGSSLQAMSVLQGYCVMHIKVMDAMICICTLSITLALLLL